MAVVRYRVDDLPARGISAFTPVFCPQAVASSQGEQHVFGAPGTMPVPAPAPAALAPISFDPKTQPSHVSPDVRTPDIYFGSTRNMHPPVRVRSTNELPTPAIDYRRVPRVAMSAPHVGGRRIVPWPRVFQRWGSVTGTQGG